MLDNNYPSLLSKTNLEADTLMGKVAIVTGAGGGIGYEAAASLLWLGATVIIAEINHKRGKIAAKKLSQYFGKNRVAFFHVDVGNRFSV